MYIVEPMNMQHMLMMFIRVACNDYPDDGNCVDDDDYLAKGYKYKMFMYLNIHTYINM